MMTTTQEQIEWLEGEKPFFDKKVRDMYSDIQRKLRAAEEMAEALRIGLSFAKNCDGSVPYCFEQQAEEALKKWEGNNAN